MKKSYFSLLNLAIVVICKSCTSEPQPMAYITSTVNVPITLYGERDTVFLAPLQRTYLCHVDVIDGQFTGVSGVNWIFSILDPVVKIGLSDTIYNVPDQYQYFLKDIDNYMYSISSSSSSSSPVKYESSNYDYTLRADFIKEIIQASIEAN